MISAAYLAQISQLHATDLNWGTTGDVYADHVFTAAKAMGAKSILDYGCGKGVLLTHLADDVDEQLGNVALQGYDPAVDGFTDAPLPADLVVCTDVLEHVEPEHLKAVLSHLQDLTKGGALIVINTGPAVEKLPDGRNAHLIQKPFEWWMEQMLEFFIIDQVISISDQSFMLACHPWTEQTAKAIEDMANFNPGDPVPDLSRINEVRAMFPHENTGRPKVRTSGMLQSFSYKAE